MELQSRGEWVHSSINRWNVGYSWIVNVYILFGFLSGFVWSDQGKCDKSSKMKMVFTNEKCFTTNGRPSS